MKTNVFVVGPSGSGKSSALKNMNPKSTAILNTERKALPFKGGGKFEKNVPCNNLGDYITHSDYCLKHEDVEVVVTESFTSLCEMIYLEATKAYDGYDVWDYYKKELLKIFHTAKNSEDKYQVFLGIDALIEGAGGVEERYVKVDGSWKKSVEKEFVVVVFTDVREIEGVIEHRFITNKIAGFTNTSVKSPEGMLPPTMPNDLNLLIQYIKEYENGEDPSWEVKPDTKKK